MITLAVPAYADELIVEGTAPVVNATYKVTDSIATVTVEASSEYGIQSIIYLRGSVSSTDNPVWEQVGIDITSNPTFQMNESDWLSFKVTDTKGNITTTKLHVSIDFHAVWISYLEFKSTGYTESEFRTHVTTMFEKVADMGMNAVIVHIRPFGDAMYDSQYFPWSKYVSGTQGVDPGFDPLEIMIEIAHNLGLSFHAWLNPYRVTLANTNVNTLALDNPARTWLTDDTTANDRNILSFGGNLYYNPSSLEVRNLIRNGVKEIVQNYDVDGIHFDDYFYPTMGSNYAKLFDAPEYQAYVTDSQSKGVTVLSIADWRRRNVNWLIKNIYNDVKKIDQDVVFGISPGGFLDTLQMNDRYYCDIKTWMSKPGYIDYICPQIYWSFSNKTYPFGKTVDRWSALLKTDSVNLYIGIPVYKAGSNEESEFKTNPNILVDMIEYGRNSGMVNGYFYYRYEYFNSSVTKKAVNNLLNAINN
jgi:uncharacterized lipoprotein YddW (UPF0748 family)